MRFIFNPEREAVTEESGDGVNRLIRASELIAATSDADSARTYYHYASDEMGSITHIVDEAGKVQNRYEYDAWGNITAQEENVPNRFKFTGQQFDPVAQQYYLRARFYNPVIARFTQEDTYRGDGLNLYAYCANNPVRYWDPSGYARACVKEVYDRLRNEDPTLTSAEAHKRALQELGRDRLNDPNAMSELLRIQGKIQQNAAGQWYDPKTGQYVTPPTSQMNQPTAPTPNNPTDTGGQIFPRRDRKSWNKYLNDIEAQTGQKMTDEQRKLVTDAFFGGDEGDYARLSKSEHDAHRDAFNAVKGDLRQQWSAMTGQPWPQTEEGINYDAHEIIPNEWNSPLEAWNIYPARRPDEHQRGIHRSGAPLYDIFPR